MPQSAAANLELIDLRTRHDEVLLQDLYEELYLPNFPIPEQQEDPSLWKPLLWGPPAPPPKPVLRLIVVGEHLKDRQRRTLYGFIMPEFFRGSGCGLLTYLAVSSRFRRRGVARFLIDHARNALWMDARAHGCQLNAIFGEVNDPRKISGSVEEVFSRKMLQILRRLGARFVPIEYVQPELKPSQGRSYSLSLVSFPVDQQPITHLASAVVRGFLHEFYGALGIAAPELDRDFIKMMVPLAKAHVELTDEPNSIASKG